jgi:penicillin-binding protein 2
MMVSQGGTGALTSGPSVRKIYEAIYGIEGTDRKKKSAVLENSEPAKRLPTIKKDGSVNAVPGTKRIDELLRAKYIGGGNG